MLKCSMTRIRLTITTMVQIMVSITTTTSTLTLQMLVATTTTMASTMIIMPLLQLQIKQLSLLPQKNSAMLTSWVVEKARVIERWDMLTRLWPIACVTNNTMKHKPREMQQPTKSICKSQLWLALDRQPLNNAHGKSTTEIIRKLQLIIAAKMRSTSSLQIIAMISTTTTRTRTTTIRTTITTSTTTNLRPTTLLIMDRIGILTSTQELVSHKSKVIMSAHTQEPRRLPVRSRKTTVVQRLLVQMTS